MLDQKYFGDCQGELSYEARDEDIVPDNVAFKGAQAETNTQKPKVMFLTVVSPAKAVFMMELDWSKHKNKKDQERERGQLLRRIKD